MSSAEYLESRIGVMESKWFEHRNTSIRELFNFLSELRYHHHHAYRYEMFGGEREFKETFNRLAEKNGIHYIYIATHGDDDRLGASMGGTISKTAIANCILKADEPRGKLVGIYFGSCLFGSQKNLENLLVKGSKLRWVAGYELSVDFIQSSILDILFFNSLLNFRKNEAKTEIQAIKATADLLKKNVEGLINELKFSLYLWENNDCIKLI